MKQIIGFQILGVQGSNTILLETGIVVSEETLPLEKENLLSLYCENKTNEIFLIVRDKTMGKHRTKLIREFHRKISKKLRQNIYYVKR